MLETGLLTGRKKRGGNRGEEPQYERIRVDIIARIRAGKWGPGEAIPPLNQLQKRYPASRATILKAVHRLEEEGYLSIEHGRGTFVRANPPGQQVGILCGDDIFSVPPPPFTAAVCHGLKQWLTAAGFSPRIYVAEGYEPGERGEVINPSLHLDFKRNFLNGLILVSTDPLPWLLATAEARHLPVVDIGANTDSPGHIAMDTDHALEAALDWFALCGRQRPAIISGEGRNMYEKRFQQGVVKRGMTLCRNWHGEVMFSNQNPVGDGQVEVQAEAAGFGALQRLWQGDDPPDALVVLDDVVAKGVAQAALALGIRVPEDLLLFAAGNSQVPIFYPVSMVRYLIPTEQLIERAGESLLAQLRGEPPPAHSPLRGRIHIETLNP